MKKLEREVYFNDKKIVEISTMELPTGYGNRINHNVKVYIFEDGTYIKATDTKDGIFKYVCVECGKEFYSSSKPEYKYDKPYICNVCRGLNHNPFKGKKHTQEFKDKLSSERKGVWNIGENNPMYGKNWQDFTTPEVIERHNRKLSERFSGENNPMYGKSIRDFMTEDDYILWKQHVKESGYHSKSEDEQKEISKKISDGQKKCMESDPEYYHEIKSKAGSISIHSRERFSKTSPEIIVENWLKSHNIDFDYSAIMGSKRVGHFQYDFIIHGKRILIEVNGDYWHGNPNLFNIDGSDGKRKLNDIQLDKIKRDKLKLEFAKNHNFEVIYIWEEEINNNDFSKLNKLL